MDHCFNLISNTIQCFVFLHDQLKEDVSAEGLTRYLHPVMSDLASGGCIFYDVNVLRITG